MGFGLPAALGAKIAKPDHLVKFPLIINRGIMVI
jgi:TPP-dependent 2-oxoacid decarboxylase